MKIPAYKSFLYVEVYLVIEWREESVYKTKKLGYALASRPKKENELYVSLSVKKEDTELDLGELLQ